MLKETVEWCRPTRGTKYSACVDLYAREDVVIGATIKKPERPAKSKAFL